jgi:hypothetical protein
MTLHTGAAEVGGVDGSGFGALFSRDYVPD